MPRPEEIHSSLQPYLWIKIGNRCVLVWTRQFKEWLQRGADPKDLANGEFDKGSTICIFDQELPLRELEQKEIQLLIDYCEMQEKELLKLRGPKLNVEIPEGLIRYGK